MPKHKIAALVGMCGSGKSVVCDMFVEKGWKRIYFGGVTMDELARRGLEKNEANERRIREELRREHGPAAFAKLLLPSIEKASEEAPTILDGLYSWSEYKCLKQHFGDDITVVAVITDRALRYERLTTRTIRPLTNEEAESRDWAEIENLEKGGPISIADRFILNNGDTQVLKSQIDALIEEVLSAFLFNLLANSQGYGLYNCSCGVSGAEIERSNKIYIHMFLYVFHYAKLAIIFVKIIGLYEKDFDVIGSVMCYGSSVHSMFKG